MPPGEQCLGTLIKVCGVRSADQARRVLALGADAVGVVTVPGSPRRVSEPEAAQIASIAGGRAVLVVTGECPGTPEFLRLWPGPVQVHDPRSDPGRRYVLAGPIDMAEPPASWARPSARLVDGSRSGSGAAWRWHRPAGENHLPLIVAGGLDASNVSRAIEAVQPWAVDVSSGVERERGVKDLALVEAFIRAVREADARHACSRAATPASFAALA